MYSQMYMYTLYLHYLSFSTASTTSRLSPSRSCSPHIIFFLFIFSEKLRPEISHCSTSATTTILPNQQIIMEFVNKPKPAGGAVTPSKRKRSGNSNQCFAFKKGNCEKGSECKFKHGGNEPKESTGVQQTNQPQQRRQGDRGRGGSNNQPPQAQGQARQQQQLQPRLVTSSVRNDEKVGAGDAMDVVEAPLVNAGGKAYMTQELFSALPISPLVKRALAEVMKYANMTQVSGTSE